MPLTRAARRPLDGLPDDEVELVPLTRVTHLWPLSSARVGRGRAGWTPLTYHPSWAIWSGTSPSPWLFTSITRWAASFPPALACPITTHTPSPHHGHAQHPDLWPSRFLGAGNCHCTCFQYHSRVYSPHRSGLQSLSTPTSVLHQSPPCRGDAPGCWPGGCGSNANHQSSAQYVSAIWWGAQLTYALDERLNAAASHYRESG